LASAQAGDRALSEVGQCARKQTGTEGDQIINTAAVATRGGPRRAVGRVDGDLARAGIGGGEGRKRQTLSGVGFLDVDDALAREGERADRQCARAAIAVGDGVAGKVGHVDRAERARAIHRALGERDCGRARHRTGLHEFCAAAVDGDAAAVDRTCAADHQRAAGDRGATGVGVHTGERRRARACLSDGDRARAATDDAGGLRD